MKLFLLLATLLIQASAHAQTPQKAHLEQMKNWVAARATPSFRTIEPAYNDQADFFLGHVTLTDLAAIEKKGLLAAELKTAPWSDFYWPTFSGFIANRYNDSAYRPSLTWKENSDYLLAHLGQGDNETLSPAEKYDLLVGDSNFTLTKKMIQTSSEFTDAQGQVAKWYGLCHGWSAASIMMNRPNQSVTVKAADGRDLVFRPSDTKALATLLWANGANRTRMIGGRCTNDNFPQSGARDPNCIDTNPATWHLTVVNQIGVNQHGFIMDAVAGTEVWNQPVLGYNYTYFNPRSGVATKHLRRAIVRAQDFRRDRSRAYRSPKTKYLVGITMQVTYVAEIYPSPAAKDYVSNDRHVTVEYKYDLELAADYSIVGGEWISSIHPDFLWMPVPESQAFSVGDYSLEENADTWDGVNAVPASWLSAAQNASALKTPLARVVTKLIERSN